MNQQNITLIEYNVNNGLVAALLMTPGPCTVVQLHSLCSLKTSSTQVRIFITSATTTAEEARYRGPSACRVREYRMVSTRDVVWNTSTPRERYFKRDEAMVAGRWSAGGQKHSRVETEVETCGCCWR